MTQNKKLTQLGKLGEYLVIVELLKQDIETYPSNIKNQENWDVTIILNDLSVKRIQVKTTDLQNDSTNNSLKGTDKNYDFLVIVIQDVDKYSFFARSSAPAVEPLSERKQQNHMYDIKNTSPLIKLL